MKKFINKIKFWLCKICFSRYVRIIKNQRIIPQIETIQARYPEFNIKKKIGDMKIELIEELIKKKALKVEKEFDPNIEATVIRMKLRYFVDKEK